MAREICLNVLKSEYHSDVGTLTFTTPVLYLGLFGLFPLWFLKQFSKIQESGLVEWLPNFITRTDVIRRTEKLPPKKQP